LRHALRSQRIVMAVLLAAVMALAQPAKRACAQVLTRKDARSLTVPELLERLPADPWIEQLADGSRERVVPELRRRIEAGLLTDSEWPAALAAGDVIHTRARWPAGRRLGIWIRPVPWLQRTKITVQAVEPDLGTVIADDLALVTCGNCAGFASDRQRRASLRRLPEGTTRVLCKVTIEQADRGMRGGSHRLWEGPYELPVEVVRDFALVVPASSQENENEAVRSTLCARWIEGDGEHPPRIRFAVGGEHATWPALRGLGLDLRVELWHGSTCIDTVGILGTGHTVNTGFSRLLSIPPELSGIGPDAGEWSLVVAGVPDDILTHWEADRWWNGKLTLPLSLALQNCDR
jgi:hypothetical protein